jgi:hypothetical protein
VVYKRGDVVQRLVNGSLDTLFTVGRRPRWEVWFLLHHLESDGCAVELSRPAFIDPDGRVAGWHTRLLLPTAEPGALGAVPSIVVPGPSPAGAGAGAGAGRPVPEVDVPVRRRVV